jgi:hypothetical protein
MSLVGMGMYPTNDDGSVNPCYDSTRPDWLPYWIDDPTESACKYSSPSLVGQMGAVVGAAGGAIVSGAATAIGGAVSNAVSNTTSGGLILGLAVAFGVFLLVKQ